MTPTVEAPAPPSRPHGAHDDRGFIRRYVFSTDHKVIGIQYIVTGLRDGAGRRGAGHADPPAARLARAPVAVARRGSCPTGMHERRHDAGVLPRGRDDARHHHGVLLHLVRAGQRLRQLPRAAAGRRARHGVPVPEHAVVLDRAAVGARAPGVVLRGRRRGGGRAGRRIRRSARCASAVPGSQMGQTIWLLEHGAVHRVVHDERPQHRRHGLQRARAGHVDDAACR